MSARVRIDAETDGGIPIAVQMFLFLHLDEPEPLTLLLCPETTEAGVTTNDCDYVVDRKMREAAGLLFVRHPALLARAGLSTTVARGHGAGMVAHGWVHDWVGLDT